MGRSRAFQVPGALIANVTGAKSPPARKNGKTMLVLLVVAAALIAVLLDAFIFVFGPAEA